MYGAYGTIAGGFSNYINGYAATVAGGWDQNAYEAYSCVSVSLHIVSPVDGWSLIAVRCLLEFTGSLAEEPLETLMLTLQQLPVVNQMQSRVRGVALVEVSATLPVRTQARSVAVATTKHLDTQPLFLEDLATLRPGSLTQLDLLHLPLHLLCDSPRRNMPPY